jgi:hypothetical protein
MKIPKVEQGIYVLVSAVDHVAGQTVESFQFAKAMKILPLDCRLRLPNALDT